MASDKQIQRMIDEIQYSILKYGRPMLTGIEDLEEANKEALRFVTLLAGSEFVEIRDSANETVTIGYFDGGGFIGQRISAKLKRGRIVAA